MGKNISFKQIGNRLRLLRGRLGQKEIAKKIGISLRAYQRYEHGDRLPPLDILYQISVIYNVSLEWIIKGTGEKERQKDELILAVDNLGYIFNHGTIDLMDFMVEVLELAKSYCQLAIEIDNKSPEEIHNDFKDFLNEILKLVPKALLTSYDSTKRERKLLDDLESEKGDNSTNN